MSLIEIKIYIFIYSSMGYFAKIWGNKPTDYTLFGFCEQKTSLKIREGLPKFTDERFFIILIHSVLKT